jgi:hypothetical protein
VQNNSFGRGLYAAQSGDPGVSEGASRTFPVIHTMRAAQAAVVALIERCELPSVSRTGDLRLIHAASCPFR